jgi:hypothetical protein
MSPTELLRELVYPARNLSVMLSALFIFLMLEFAAFCKLLGLFLALLIVPSLFHYLMRLLDARAKGREPGPLEVDDLMWHQNAWRLFMIVHVVVTVYALYIFASLFKLPGLLVTAVSLAAVLPASLAVLAITRSPLESLNPRAIAGVIRRTGRSYWLLPSVLILIAVAVRLALALGWQEFIIEFLAFYLFLVFFSLTGAVVRPHDLYQEVEIYEPVAADAAALEDRMLENRTSVLNHAYGFISRDNRAGGFRHIENWLREDPDPESAWGWFFDQMLRWENRAPALFFAQSYLHELLAHGENRAAVKVMMRCRFENDSFVPLEADLPAALAAAEASGNQELADFLRARV